MFVQADGGWDPTSFCDPKANTPGEPVINHWAERDEIRQAGNIPYAPFASNAAFFEKYYDRMLVINGVDAQTNSHTVGIVHNWSGRNSEGYPAMSALLAARYGPELPVAYLSFGGYSDTGGVARYTRLNNAELLRNIARPAENSEKPERRYMSEADWAAVRARHAAGGERDWRVGAEPDAGGGCATGWSTQSAFASSEGLTAYTPTRSRRRRSWRRWVEYTSSSGQHFLQRTAASGAVDGAGVQDGCGGQRGPVARRGSTRMPSTTRTRAGCWAT